MYCRLPKTRTLATLNFMLSQTKTVFPLDFCDTITVILPLVTWTLDNSTFLLTRRNFHFPLGHFLHNFNLDNSNREHEHKYQYWQLCTSSQTLFSLKKNMFSSQFLDFSLLLSFVTFFTLCYLLIYTAIYTCTVLLSLDFSIL